MKKLFALFAVLMTTLTASAQFEADKIYCGASLSSIDLNYSGKGDFSVGVNGQLGYMVDDDLMLYATAGYDHQGKGDDGDHFTVGAGGRYYIEQNGIFLGANVKYLHAFSNYNDIMPGVEVGYAFFVSKTVTIEPALYYQQSFKNHSDYSTIGLRVGIGIYL